MPDLAQRINYWPIWNRHGKLYTWLAWKMRRRARYPNDERWQRLSRELLARRVLRGEDRG